MLINVDLLVRPKLTKQFNLNCRQKMLVDKEKTVLTLVRTIPFGPIKRLCKAISGARKGDVYFLALVSSPAHRDWQVSEDRQVMAFASVIPVSEYH